MIETEALDTVVECNCVEYDILNNEAKMLELTFVIKRNVCYMCVLVP